MDEKRSLKTLTRVLWLVALGLATSFFVYDENFSTLFATPKRHEFSHHDRTIKALIVVDSTIVDRYPNRTWRRATGDLVANVSKTFEKQLGIRIVTCKYLEWPKELALNITALQNMIEPQCDIKVGITAVRLVDERLSPVAGKAAYDPVFRGSYDAAIITTYLPHRAKAMSHRIALAHEIAHLFGAQHVKVDGRGLLMNAGGRPPGLKIDDENWEIMIQNKYKDFQKDAVLRKFAARTMRVYYRLRPILVRTFLHTFSQIRSIGS